MHYSEKTPEDVERLAKKIIGQLQSNKMDKQFRRVWKTHNLKSLYENMYAPILYERIPKRDKNN